MTKRHFAVAVKSVIIKDDEALCLLRSDKEVKESRINSVDLWDLPGGGLQYFETLDAGLMREIKEETSIEVSIIKPLNTHDIIKPQLHIIFITYLCQYLGGEVVLSNEHKQYKWIHRDNLKREPLQKWLKKLLASAFAEYEACNGGKPAG